MPVTDGDPKRAFCFVKGQELQVAAFFVILLSPP